MQDSGKVDVHLPDMCLSGPEATIEQIISSTQKAEDCVVISRASLIISFLNQDESMYAGKS
jgi:hypothetical protein